MVNEIQGKTKPRNRKTYIYTEEGMKKEIKEIWEDFIEYWRVTIYQKDKTNIHKLWHGGEGQKGWRIEYVSYVKSLRENEGDKVMSIPIITGGTVRKSQRAEKRESSRHRWNERGSY